MQKKIIILLITLILVGCGISKKESYSPSPAEQEFINTFNKEKENSDYILLCEQINENATSSIGEIIWKDNKISKMVISAITLNKKENARNERAFNKIAKLTLDTMKKKVGINENINGVVITMDKNYSKLEITINTYIDFKKADKNILDNIGLNYTEEELKTTIDDMKYLMENNGYTCKITK